MNPFDLSAGPFLALYITALALGVGAGVLVRRYDPRPPAAPMGDSLDPIALAYLAGGRARALDAAMIGLLEAGAVTFDSLKKAVSPAEPAPWVVPCLAPFQRALDTTSSLAALTQRLDAPLAAVRATLVARGLAFDKAGSAAAAWRSAAPVAVLAALGAARIVLGAHRGHPVGFIALLTLAAVFATIVLASGGPRLRRAGRVLLTDSKARGARLMRAPADGELMQAVALAGAPILMATPYAAFARMRHPSGGDGGAFAGGDGGSGDGGGGGGGCGGCGGH